MAQKVRRTVTRTVTTPVNGNGNGEEIRPIFEGVQVNAELAFGIEFGRHKNLNVFCPFCENPESSLSQSCSVSIYGLFNCKACGRGGTAAEFYSQAKQVPLRQAKQIVGENKPRKAKRVAPTAKPRPITDDLVVRMHTTLMRSTVEISYLMVRRGFTKETIEFNELGCDETRITFPIRRVDGSLYAVRRYLPNHGKQPKFVWHEGGNSTPILYPEHLEEAFRTSKEPYLILNEGEADNILLRQEGFDAFTVLSGVLVWEPEFTERVISVGKPVVLLYDVNDKDNDLGQRVARERGRMLLACGIPWVKVVRLTLPTKYVGGDVTNWYVDERRTTDELRQLIDATPVLAPTPEDWELADKDEAPSVTLYDAAKSDYFYKSIRLRCLVAGRTSAPYLLPHRVKIDTADDEGNTHTIEKTFDPWEGLILSMIQCSTQTQHRFIKSVLNIDPKTPAAITVQEALNVEEIFLIPAIDHERDPGPYVLRQAYFVGHGLQTNQTYDFRGYTLPDPRSQAATHILTSAVPTATDLESFELDKDLFHQLKDTFGTDDVFAKMEHIANDLANNVTKIYGRSDLHIAMDLVFHSVLSFNFDNIKLRKGWLEALIVGDTRTGKGFVGEGLIKHYGVGEVVSAESMTSAGLIGGIQKMGDNFQLTWGKIPLNDKRLLILDECSNLSREEIAEMSRIRSEGVIEITKIITEKTSARTRLIWLANPRPSYEGLPKRLDDGSFSYGILSVPELIGAAEDIARFDYALTASKKEVKSSEINKARAPSTTAPKYPTNLCRKLIVWIWSRTPDQIVFDADVLEYTLKAAHDLGNKFSPSVPLIQAEDVRFKLARIACAAAGRTFSTDDGIRLRIKKAHVEFAYNFLYHIYSKPSCGYAQMSAVEREESTLRDPHQVLASLQQVNELLPDLVSGLLAHQQITARDLIDYAGVDIFQARTIISELVRLRALVKCNQYYKKKQAFRMFLQSLKVKLISDPDLTTMDETELDELTNEGAT